MAAGASRALCRTRDNLFIRDDLLALLGLSLVDSDGELIDRVWIRDLAVDNLIWRWF